MNFFSISYFIFAFVIILITICISFNMYKKYRFAYLSSYLYYLIAINIFGLLYWVGKNLSIHILNERYYLSPGNVIWLFSFLAFPLAVISVYLFINFIQTLLNRELSVNFNKWYILFSIIFLSGLIIVSFDYLKTQNELLLSTISLSINLLSLIILYITIIYAFLKAKKMENIILKKGIKNFTLIYYFAFTLYCILSCFFISNSIFYYFLPFLFLFLNLPPLFYLRSFLWRHYGKHPIEIGDKVDMSHFYSNYSITNREQEIIRLVLKGKSHKEIKNELKISINTVRNHVYKIYRKLGAKNKLHLINLIKNHKKEM